jgi:MFS family permease
MILTPFMGLLVDKVGHRIHILGGTGISLGLIHLVLSQTTKYSWFIPAGPLVAMGISYSLLIIVWPSFNLLSPPHLVGIGYGISSSILNLSLTVFPMIVHIWLIGDPHYYNVELFFIGVALTSVIFSLWLYKEDYKKLLSKKSPSSNSERSIVYETL